MFEKIKRKSKRSYYSQKILECKNNAKENMECYEGSNRQISLTMVSSTNQTYNQ